MATIYIDGKGYEVDPTNNLLEECLSLGLDLPYFCWHPALGSVGACRQCAVKQYRDENDQRGRIVMACLTPASDGTRISLRDRDAVQFRAAIIEFLMTNHPHDCPVCDEGGECHLQDMTVMTGHNYRTYGFGKRTFQNQNLGPFINHEMNRCITCYRCVRFYKDYAGGKDLDAFASKNHVYFGRYEDGPLESEFSGNLVEVCPTGVFNDKTLHEHFTRKWDLQTAPSVCAHCSLGCNTIAGERYGTLRRILNRYNSEVNGYFLCDRGRFGYEFVNRPERPKQVSRKGSNGLEPISKETSLNELGAMLGPDSRVIGIGSPRASLESNFALRAFVGAENFYSGMAEREQQILEHVLAVFRQGKVRTPSLRDVEESDAVLILGEDVTQTAPMLDLAVRQAVKVQPRKQQAEKLRIPDWDAASTQEVVQHDKGPLYIATSAPAKLDEVATATYRGAPDQLARLGFAVAHELDAAAPAVKGLTQELQQLAKTIAKSLEDAERPVVISGSSSGSRSVADAAVQVALALASDERPANLCFTASECNSIGLALLEGRPIGEALGETARADAVVVIENDLYRRASVDSVNRFLDGIKNLIVIDHTAHATYERATIAFPAASFAEVEGTLVNNELRAQRFFQVFVAAQEVQASWRWLAELARASAHSQAAALESPDALLAGLEDAFPIFNGLREKLPGANFRVKGEKIPRQSPRYSGRTAMTANISVHEPKPPEDPDSPFSFSMEGYPNRPPSPVITRFWSPAWNSVQSLNKFQAEVGGALVGGDPGMRLVEPAAGVETEFSSAIPEDFKPRRGELLAVGLHHIFGSEELSSLAGAVSERIPAPTIALNPDDASALGIEEQVTVEIEVDGTTYRQPAHLMAGLPRGVVGVPVGVEFCGLNLPGWSRCRKV